MSNCKRHWCPACGEEMIHRDNRKPWESASAFGQVTWRCGPKELTVGDIDLYVDKRRGKGWDATLYRVIERFQPRSPMKDRQGPALNVLDQMITHCATCAGFTAIKLLDGSGVYTLRGQLMAAAAYPYEIDFVGPQIISRLDGTTVLETNDPKREIFDWLNGGSDWTIRKQRAGQMTFEDAERAHLTRLDRKLEEAAKLGSSALKTLWQCLPTEDQHKLKNAKDTRHKPAAERVGA